MTIKIKKEDGTYIGAANHTEVIRELAVGQAKLKLENSVAALTDSSGGDATPTADEVQFVDAFVGAANSGTSLAQKAATETALGKVKNAVTELATKTNEILALLGLTQLTDNSGGTAADGTIAAMDTSTTAATTGCVVATTNAIVTVINDAFNELGLKANIIAKAVGIEGVNLAADFASKNGTIAAISTSTGTAADPGVTKAEVDAALVIWADNVAYLAALLNAARAAAPVKAVVV